MAKQVIEIDCPDGIKPVWKNNKIEFVPIDLKEKLQTVEDAEQVLQDAGYDTDDYYDLVSGLNLYKFLDLQVVLKALNGPDFKWNLIKGVIWYPWVRFIREDRLSKEKYDDEKVIGHFKYERTRYALVGGGADNGGWAGLSVFDSTYGVGGADASIGFLSCKDEATARYVSEHFGKLVFEAVTTFKVEDIEWID